MDGLHERGLKLATGVVEAIGAVGEAAGPGIDERGHDVAGARSADPFFNRDEVNLAPALAGPLIGAHLEFAERFPLGGGRNPLEQVDWWEPARYDPVGVVPFDERRFREGLRHHTPRAASR